MSFSGSLCPLLADSGNWHKAINPFESQRKICIPSIDTIAASLIPLSADWLPALSYLQRDPIDLDKPHILASASDTGFLRFKEQDVFKKQ